MPRRVHTEASRAHYEYLESWGLTQGCYGKVTGYIYNAGSQPEDKAQLVFNLIDASRAEPSGIPGLSVSEDSMQASPGPMR